jgi:hypothetical protein
MRGPARAPAVSDFALRRAGTISLLCPLTPAAKTWIAQRILNGCIVLDSRQVDAILAAIEADGLSVINRNEFPTQQH